MALPLVGDILTAPAAGGDERLASGSTAVWACSSRRGELVFLFPAVAQIGESGPEGGGESAFQRFAAFADSQAGDGRVQRGLPPFIGFDFIR